MILTTIIVTILCAVLYRLGGMGGAWWKNTKVRDLGVPLVCTVWCIMYLDASWWQHLIAFGLMFAALTTYYDKIFGYDNFYVHGLVIGLAYLVYGLWLVVVVRAIIMALFMGLWCKYFKNDYVEECGRGAIIGITLPMLLI